MTPFKRANYRLTDAKCCGTCDHLGTYMWQMEDPNRELTCLVDDGLEQVSIIGVCDNYRQSPWLKEKLQAELNKLNKQEE